MPPTLPSVSSRSTCTNMSVCLSSCGHNGAGKSTLMHVLAGSLRPDGGDLSVLGEAQSAYSPDRALQLGIRCVFQELSLCPNLTAAVNTRVFHAGMKGFNWRKRAADLIQRKLEEIFPEHGIDPSDLVQDLSIGRRQMLEVARAFTVTDEPVRMVILDEPTSSLDALRAGQLLAYVRRTLREGIGCILISHILGEILDNCDRIVVMRDGKVVIADRADAFTRDSLVAAMGGGHRQAAQATRDGNSHLRARAPVRVRTRPRAGGELVAHEGEIIGLAGLAGHGQTDLLLQVFSAANGGRSVGVGVDVDASVSLVAGDRQADGVFPEWSILENITVGSLAALRRGLLISGKCEQALADEWRRRIGIRTPDLRNNILSLSGGNQQKALFARALGSGARIVLMDDPMRGVDIGTKLEVYDLIRNEADRGRTFLWYTTEMDELQHCDHVYVFRNGNIVADLARGDLTEERVIQSSFLEAS
jgi:ribose transport system ATP-binding protein